MDLETASGESEEQQKLSSIERPEILLQWSNLSVEAARADVNGASKRLGRCVGGGLEFWPENQGKNLGRDVTTKELSQDMET